MADLSPCDTLRAAAARLRELAKSATPGLWHYTEEDLDFQPCVKAEHDEWVAECGPVDCISAPGGRGDHDARWIATMSPAVAESLAGWLDVEVDRVECGYITDALHHALVFARSILEQP